jgi:sugar/nucleoside kinase (ribokinase family)
MTRAPDYLVIGHITADLTPEGRSLGGTTSYAARVAHAFELSVTALTSAAVDEPLLDGLTRYAEVESLPADSTSTFENIYTLEGRVQYIRGVAHSLTAEHVPLAWRAASLVHLAPLTDEVDPQIAHAFPNATVMLTLQGWLRRWDASGRVHFKRWFDPDVLRSIDIVVFSEHDIAEAPELESLFARSVETLVVTRGERGGTVYTRGRRREYGTPEVEVVEPTGAGDVFAASLLSGLRVLRGDMDAAIRVAARLAATTVTRDGLEGAPTADEARDAIAEAQLQP